MDDLTSRFLDAFNAIENWMRHELNAPEHVEFRTLVADLAEANNGFKRHARTLKRLAKLRNLIAHDYSRDEPLAVPTLRTVEQICAIRTELVSPPSLYSVAAFPVQMCRPTDPLGCSVAKMHEGVFSQLPIYDGNNFLGLLTAETIARWLACNLNGGVGLVEERPISEIIQHQEDADNHTFLSRASTVADGLTAFDKFLRRGKRLEAILITENGLSTERPLRIATIHDIPKLRQAIQE